MIETKFGADASDVTHGSTRVLFVEGADDSIDATVLRALLDIDIKPIGKSSEIRAAARAFLRVHPEYFFLVDRDHCDIEEVERSWKEFAAAKSNLIIWRKKEIENYFLEPSFLLQSRYVILRQQQNLKDTIIADAQQSLYLTVVCQVVTSVREEFKHSWIQLPTEVADFPNREKALDKLLSMPEFQQHETKVSDALQKNALESRFDIYLERMTGGGEFLAWKQGEWLSLIPGKEIFHRIVHDNKFFDVVAEGGRHLQGKEREKVIVRDLMSKGAHLPPDFIRLRKLFEQRTGEGYLTPQPSQEKYELRGGR